jgi:general stress protein YciG
MKSPIERDASRKSIEHTTAGHGPQQHEQLTPDRPPLPFDADTQPQLKRPRGFAVLDRARVREIAREGGRAAHARGTAHEFTSEEARLAGSKGGRATRTKRKAMVGGADR